MISEVENILKKYNLLNSERTFIVGFSGGYDSYCLLDVMWELSQIYGFTVIPAHLNHNWRGKEAYNEQARCQEIAIKYRLNFITDTLDDNVKISENSARNERYKFFEKYAKLFDAIVLTAHNANDNAETLIYRIAKGTGISGLSGIPETIEKNGVKFIRPLLGISREEIENYCKEKQLLPNEDSSNFSVKYKRNFIRKEVLPLLKEINPNIISAINSLSELATENEKIIDDILKNYFEGDKIVYSKFSTSSEAIKSRVVHKFLIQKNIEYDRKKISEIVEFLSDFQNLKKTFSITTNLWIKFDGEFIYYCQKADKNFSETKINGIGIYEICLGKKFEISKPKDYKNFPKETDMTAIISLNNLNFPFTLRTRREGDIIQPFGMKGKMKLKKYLIDKKIPIEKRDNILVLAKENEILWVIGVGISEKLRVAKTPDYVFKYSKEDS